MTIYEDGVYLVIIVSESILNKIDMSLTISHTDIENGVAYLLGNEKETEYLQQLLNVDLSEYCFDYFKILKIRL